MEFKLLPVLDEIAELYSQPISRQRFEHYLFKLQGISNNDLVLPIGGFNPMAKDEVVMKLKALKSYGIEEMIAEVAEKLSSQYAKLNSKNIEIAFNLADDLGGSWTGRFITGFDSIFKFQGVFNRDFCTPYFWTSESYDQELIKNRILEYAYRTVYWLKNGKVKTLQDYLSQEIFVREECKIKIPDYHDEHFQMLAEYYEQQKNEDNYNILFNFFYGDDACGQLNFPSYGINNLNGFEYATILASKK